MRIVLLWTMLNLVHTENISSDPIYRYVNNGNDKRVNITECAVMPCMTKCCPAHQIYLYDEEDKNTTISCIYIKNISSTYSYNGINLENYSDVPIYNKNLKKNVIVSNKKIEDFTLIFSENFQAQLDYSIEIEQAYSPPNHEIYILENGHLAIRKINYFNQWVNDLLPGQFCVEHRVNLNYGGVISKPQMAIRMLVDDVGDEQEEEVQRNINLAYGQLVSCVFLLLVLAVYALLPELRNLAGLILIAYVVTLITAFILRAVQVFSSDSQLEDITCLWLGFMLYYAVVASFTWINVMSFDIWWVTRGFRKMDRRGLMVKLAWYGLYGWGAPLLPVIFMIVVENLDLTHLPDFVKPHYSSNACFMEEDERRLYMNGPILVTLCVNILLFLTTAYNIWRIKQGVTQHNVGDSRKNKREENRFSIYLKLAVVMGINWILEIVSSLYDVDSKWWYIPDVFNSLTGVLIFIIFICKRSIIVLLCKRFKIGDKLIQKWQPVDSKCCQSSRVNSKRRILDSVTDTSDFEDASKSLYIA